MKNQVAEGKKPGAVEELGDHEAAPVQVEEQHRLVLQLAWRERFEVVGAAQKLQCGQPERRRPQAGIVSDLVAAVFFLRTAWSLYVLLRPVDKNGAGRSRDGRIAGIT